MTSAATGKTPKLLDQMSNVLRTIQELLGHADLSTTMIYMHVVNKGPLGVKSPAVCYEYVSKASARRTRHQETGGALWREFALRTPPL